MPKSSKHKVELPPKTIVEYFKDKSGRRRGVFLATKIDGVIRFSFAMCRRSNNPYKLKQNDTFSERQALNIAGGRLIEKDNTGQYKKYQLPRSTGDSFREFFIRCYRYYKDEGMKSNLGCNFGVGTEYLDGTWAKDRVTEREQLMKELEERVRATQELPANAC